MHRKETLELMLLLKDRVLASFFLSYLYGRFAYFFSSCERLSSSYNPETGYRISDPLCQNTLLDAFVQT